LTPLGYITLTGRCIRVDDGLTRSLTLTRSLAGSRLALALGIAIDGMLLLLGLRTRLADLGALLLAGCCGRCRCCCCRRRSCLLLLLLLLLLLRLLLGTRWQARMWLRLLLLLGAVGLHLDRRSLGIAAVLLHAHLRRTLARLTRHWTLSRLLLLRRTAQHSVRSSRRGLLTTLLHRLRLEDVRRLRRKKEKH